MAAPAQETRQLTEQTTEVSQPADPGRAPRWVLWTGIVLGKIGRASCRERV